MLIGVVSDSHDNLTQIDKAVQLLNHKNVALVLHAGDYVSPFTVAHFKKLDCNFIGVFRNRFTQVTVQGYRMGLLHGDETELLNALIESGYFNAIIHGHSHNRSISLFFWIGVYCVSIR